MNNKKREKLLKKLLYQSCNRGCRETDLIIGEFAKQNLDSMNNEALELFSQILQLPDTDIYDWYTKKKPVPREIINQVLINLLNFVPIR